MGILDISPVKISMPKIKSLSIRTYGDDKLTKVDRMKIIKRDNFRCTYCNKKKGAEDLQVHHIKSRAEFKRKQILRIPSLIESGSPREKMDYNDPLNLTTLCNKCHNETKKK